MTPALNRFPVYLNLPEELSLAFEAAKFWISAADFFKPGTVDAHKLTRFAGGAKLLILLKHTGNIRHDETQNGYKKN
jgi:hypothetical protein